MFRMVAFDELRAAKLHTRRSDEVNCSGDPLCCATCGSFQIQTFYYDNLFTISNLLLKVKFLTIHLKIFTPSNILLRAPT